MLFQELMKSFHSSGEGDEKGKVMGIFRSLGALSRALGPTIACAGNKRFREIYLYA